MFGPKGLPAAVFEGDNLDAEEKETEASCGLDNLKVTDSDSVTLKSNKANAVAALKKDYAALLR